MSSLFIYDTLVIQTTGGEMRLLREKMGFSLDTILSEGTTEDELPRTRIYQKRTEVTIIWAAEMEGVKLYLLNEKPMRLLIVASFLQREELTGVQDIARSLEVRGILETASKDAHLALPQIIKELLRLRYARSGVRSGQLPLLLGLIP